MNAFHNWFQGIDLEQIIQWLMFAAAALVSISIHESSHALVAARLGDDTAKRMGRISLNPLRHLDPIGFVMMVVAHFGWARPVPVNMHRFRNPKTGMALTAAAGPVSNLLLALISGIAFWVMLEISLIQIRNGANELLQPKSALYYLNEFLYISMLLNAGLAVFNLIPISPLDGSKILAIVLPDKAHQLLMQYERYGFAVLALLLFTGVLDRPLEILRSGVIEGIRLLAVSVVRLIAGISV